MSDPSTVRSIRVIRESGGLGDMLRLFPVFDGLRAKYPNARLDFWGLHEYRDLVAHCPSVNRYIECPRQHRRPRDAKLDPKLYRYLDRGVRYDLDYDMYCPAFAHERQTRGSVTVDRVELFCRAAGLPPGPVVYRLTDAERQLGLSWRESLSCDRPIAMQAFATHPVRCWSPERWMQLGDLLLDAGFTPVWFDCVTGRIRDLPGLQEVGNPWPALAAKIWACDHWIGIDSGLFHFAGAVGIPTLMISGCTSGPILCRPYPLAHWVSGPVPISAPKGCASPCYAFPDRGYNPGICQEHGCAVAIAVSAKTVFDSFASLYSPRSLSPASAPSTLSTDP